MPGLGDIFRRITRRSRREQEPDSAPDSTELPTDEAPDAEPDQPLPASSAAAEPPLSTAAEPPLSTAAEPTLSAAAEPPLSAAAEPPLSTAAEPPPSAAAEPPPSAAAEPPPSAAAEPPLSAAAEPPPSAAAEPTPSAATEPPLSAATDPLPPITTDPPPSAAAESAPPIARELPLSEAAAVPQPSPPVPEYTPLREPAGVFASEPAGPVIAEPSPPLPPSPVSAPSSSPDDELREDHLLLDCPYCGLTEQRMGARCDNCGQVVVRLPSWAQHRRRNWLLERLAWRRIIAACAIVLFVLFVVWINYPFVPNPVIFFKNVQTNTTADDGPGVWSISGRDLRNTRFVSVGYPPPVGTIVWNTNIPEPLKSEPVSQDSNIYLGSANGIFLIGVNNPNPEEDGKIRAGWEGETPGRITAAAAVVDSHLFFGSTDKTVNAWNARTGNPEWTFPAEDTVEVPPVIVNGMVYIASGLGWLYALDAQSGSLIWKVQLNSNASGAVAVYEGRLMVGDQDGVFHVLSTRTGQERFRFRTPRAIQGSPVISEDGQRAFFASSGQLYSVRADRREFPGLYQFKQVWAQLWLWQVPGVPRPQGQQGGLWRFSPNNPLRGIHSAPALANDLGQESLYVGGHDRMMYSLNAADGSVLWAFQAENAILASPLIVKDRLIFGDASGYLYSLHREDGSVDWKIFMGSSIAIPPILSNDLLIVRTVSGDIFGIK